LIAQAAYIPLSGNANNLEAFASSFSSALLWDRLWPNQSYALGVIPGILIVSAPLLLILIISAIRQWKEIHPLRWLGLFSMILALFAGSLVVSTKIGGVNQFGKNGPVLFINERQLVTFREVKVPLVPDYEVVTLMEMAMSGNQAYLDKFYSDLAHHRFAAIVATKQNKGIKETGALAEENNVWNSQVSPYILCYYQPAVSIDAEITNVQVYVPATVSSNCP